MSKRAFVIMPYDKQFNRVYSIIIKQALEQKGYECIRQDMTSEGGYVMENVIRNLAEADIVIAELTGWNWNVAYELGMRHTMCRVGTILMCEKGGPEDTKFDIKHLNILYYDPDWMNQMGEEAIIAELIRRIEYVEQKNGASDSPVHSIFTTFPERLMALADGSQNELGIRVQALEKENEELRSRIANAGLDESDSGNEDDNIEAAIAQAIKDRIYCGSAAIDKLDELLQAGKIDEFGHFLAQVLKRGYLDAQDCRNVYIRCRRLNAPALTKVFLERVTRLYPDNEDLNIFFAEELSKVPATRDKALVIANEMIGLSRKNGKYELSTSHVSAGALGAFFNIYIRLNRYDELLKIAPLLLEEYQKTQTQCLIYRNMVTAHLHFEELQKAEDICRILMEIGPNYDLNHYNVYKLFYQTDRYELSYQALENCIACAPKDRDYYYMIASLIMDENIARTDLEEAPQRVSDEDARRYAVPFIFYCLQHCPEPDVNRAIAFLRKNGCEAALNTLQRGKISEEYDFEMVEYCVNKEVTPLFSKK